MRSNFTDRALSSPAQLVVRGRVWSWCGRPSACGRSRHVQRVGGCAFQWQQCLDCAAPGDKGWRRPRRRVQRPSGLPARLAAKALTAFPALSSPLPLRRGQNIHNYNAANSCCTGGLRRGGSSRRAHAPSPGLPPRPASWGRCRRCCCCRPAGGVTASLPHVVVTGRSSSGGGRECRGAGSELCKAQQVLIRCNEPAPQSSDTGRPQQAQSSSCRTQQFGHARPTHPGSRSGRRSSPCACSTSRSAGRRAPRGSQSRPLGGGWREMR